MRAIEIEWKPLGITVTAMLSEAVNRNLSDIFWNKLPYCSLQNHALVSGEHLYHLLPFVEFISTPAEHKEDRTLSPDGTLFLSQLQHLAIKYGPLSEYIPAAPVGHVVEQDMPLLREAGRACWAATYTTKQVIDVHVRRKGDSRPSQPLPRFECDATAPVQWVLDRINDENQKIWITPPAEVLNMHQGRITSRAGSYDQYFSTLVFLNGETRPLGYCALNGLVRLCENDAVDVATLRTIAPNFIRTPAEFLGYCGLETLWTFTQDVIAVMPHLKTKDQFRAVVGALALYANILNTWNLQYFPWMHGKEYRARDQNDGRSERSDAALATA